MDRCYAILLSHNANTLSFSFSFFLNIQVLYKAAWKHLHGPGLVPMSNNVRVKCMWSSHDWSRGPLALHASTVILSMYWITLSYEDDVTLYTIKGELNGSISDEEWIHLQRRHLFSKMFATLFNTLKGKNFLPGKQILSI